MSRFLRPMTRPIAVIGLVCLALQTGGCGRAAKTSFDYLSKGRDYYEQGEVRSAVIELKNALQLDPKNAEARFFLGQIELDRGHGEAAEIELAKAQSFGYDKGKVKVALGDAYVLQGEYQKALDDVAASPADSDRQVAAVTTVRGDAYLGLRRYDDARKAYQGAAASDSGYAKAYVGLAKLAAAQKDYAAAQSQIERAVKTAPAMVSAWLLDGDLLKIQKRYDDARKAYEHVLQLHKNSVDAYIGLAGIDMAQNRLDAARQSLSKAQGVDNTDLRVKYARAMLDYRDKKYPSARDNLQEVLKGQPNFMPGILLSGAVAYQLGSYEQAHQYLSRFVAQVPGDAAAARLLAVTDLRLNQTEDALKYIRQLLATAPDNPQDLALAGQAYLQNNDFTRATAFLSKAATLAPANAPLHTELGMGHLASGQQELAVKDLEAAVSLDPGQAQANVLLVVSHMRNKDYAKALHAVAEWKKVQPDNPVVYGLEGQVYDAKGDAGSARNSFDLALKKDANYLPAIMALASLDIEQHKGDDAVKRLTGYVEGNPKSVDAMIALSSAEFRLGREKDGVDWLKKAIGQRPSDVHLRQLLVGYYVGRRDFTSAVAAARDAAKFNSNDADTLALLGDTELAAGDVKGATDDYRTLAQLAPSSAVAQLKLAEAAIAAGDLAGARVSLQSALQMQPDFLQARVKLLSIALRQKDFAQAQALVEKVKAQLPDQPVGDALEGDVLSRQGRYAEAARSYRRAFERKPSSLMAIKLHQALASGGRKDEAAGELLDWVKAHPDDLTARLYLADFYMNSSLLKQAAGQYEAVIKEQPENLVALNNLAWLYQQAHDARAIKVAEKAYKLQPGNPGIMDTLGWILVEQGDSGRAVDLLKKASAAVPDGARIHYHYAVACLKTGDRATARSELERVLKPGVDFPEKDAARALLKRL